MKYIDSEKLKAEIERRMEDCKLPDGTFPTTTNIVRYEELSSLRNLIVSVQQEQPEVDLKKEIECSIRFLNGHHTLENGERWYKGRYEELRDFARHFYGLRNRALEEAARHIYESWMGGTMDDVRRDMVELGRVINARKEE